MTEKTYTDDLQLLVHTLPQALQHAIRKLSPEGLLEIVLDLGRPPQVRVAERALNLSDEPVDHADLEQVVAALGEFGADNRAGIEGTLHRISAIRNRKGRVIGLTLRVGRAVTGTIDLIRDLIESGKSVLMLGRPGVWPGEAPASPCRPGRRPPRACPGVSSCPCVSPFHRLGILRGMVAFGPARVTERPGLAAGPTRR